MTPLTKMLVATDGSPDAALAIRAAVGLCDTTGADLHVIHAWTQVPPTAYHALAVENHQDLYEQEAGELLRAEVERVRDIGGTVAEAHLREGRPAEKINELAEEIGAGLVVVGSRGMGFVERLAIGSVSEGVVRLAPCPVLVMRGGWPPRTVVVGDDSSEVAREAGQLAALIGKPFEARVILVRALHPGPPPPPPGYLRRAQQEKISTARLEELLKANGAKKALRERAEELRTLRGRPPQTRVVAGDVAAVVSEAAEDGAASPRRGRQPRSWPGRAGCVGQRHYRTSENRERTSFDRPVHEVRAASRNRRGKLRRARLMFERPSRTELRAAGSARVRACRGEVRSVMA